MKSKVETLGRIRKEFRPRGNLQLFQLDKPATFTCSVRKIEVTSTSCPGFADRRAPLQRCLRPVRRWFVVPAMKPKPPSNGLSTRANRCLSTAGIPAEKEAVLHALKTGALYPFFRPALYGRKTHREVCRWAGLDESFVSPTIPKNTMSLAIDNGLSFRANRLLLRAGIPADKPAVLQALHTGSLLPGKCPVNYGKQTHAELCRWAGGTIPRKMVAPMLGRFGNE